MPDIHQCPECECRFTNRTELDDHIRLEHPQAIDDDTTEFDN